MTGVKASVHHRVAPLSATEAASRAHVQIRELHDARNMSQAIALLEQVWRTVPGGELVSQSLLMAMAHSGNYVVGAFRGERIVGTCLGFLSAPAGQALHSHITAAASDAVGCGIGTALKLHQREWAIERGLTRITWTFDPVVARNAYFNLSVLGASCADYLVDFYGSLEDAVNSGQPSDRMLASWNLLNRPHVIDAPNAQAILVDVSGEPKRLAVTTASSRLRVQIPGDIAAVREVDPARALRWRIALRQTIIGVRADGWRIIGFDRSGHYLLER
jgi:predicted GNAT superfamily acetyltransferase